MNKYNPKIQLLKDKINKLNEYKKADIEIKYNNDSENKNKSLLRHMIDNINDKIFYLNRKIYSELSSSNERLIPTIFFKI
jgi:hypothetical protein